MVKVKNLKIGGGNPIRIKGMLKSPTSKKSLLLQEAKALQREGAELLRVAVQSEKDTKLAQFLRKSISIPIAADIHFKPKLALLAIKDGFDQIRLNPLNITRKKDIKEIAKFAAEKKVPIRVGVNSGGFKGRLTPLGIARQMVDKCADYIKILESQKFFDIIVSLKSADIESTLAANKEFSQNFNYPLHLGITASGPRLEGVVKSSQGLGILLNSGIGDLIRVSLTADSLLEIQVSKHILRFLNLRKFGPEIISCPTCSRCQVDLVKIVNILEARLKRLELKKPVRAAVMGCVVNGPGEASQADLGVAFSKKRGAVFKKGKVLHWSTPSKAIDDLIREVKKDGF